MLGVASRFSVLKIEGEEGPKNPNKKKAEKSKTDDKKHSQGKQLQQQQQQRKKGGQSLQGQSNVPKANGSGKSKTKGNAGGKKKVVTDAQWEEWKKKDEQYVDTNYEDELKEAILQSKLDFEEKKDVYDRVKKETEAEKRQVGGKKKKTKVMSLEQFNSMHASDQNGVEEQEGLPQNNGKSEDDPEFFERIKEEAKKTLQQEQNRKILKEREPFVNEMITIAQYQMRLEEQDHEIAELKEEVEKLKDDLTKVKSRNKKLCSILGQAEMRDKAEILVQVDKLNRVRDELTTEVASLHALLEQERSKVGMLTATEGKGKGIARLKKSVRFDASSEERVLAENF